MINTVITGSGSYIPNIKVNNDSFEKNTFHQEDGQTIKNSVNDIIQKFKDITGISSRRYVEENQSCSEIATLAAEKAVKNAKIDIESIDMIIVAHNFGDVINGSFQSDMVPSIASRVKHNLGIKNESCVPYDLIFGCPGWIQGMIQAHMFIKSGEVKRCLIIGAEALSRVVDPHDRDIMIFADGAGAVIVEGIEENEKRGIIAHATVSHSGEEKDYLGIGESYNKGKNDPIKYIKMNGRKIYSYSLVNVPKAMKFCMDKAGLDIEQLDKILIHQANEKMDEAIVQRLYKLFGKSEMKENIMPMTIDKLGNSSVATVPTLYDMIMKGKLPKHQINKGDNLLFASVGAGMNINAIVYKA